MPDQEHGNPPWAADIQLGLAFRVHPAVFQDYEPAHIEVMAAYLAGHEDGREIRRKQARNK